MENAVIYARYSSAGQNEQSIDGQVRVCTEFAERCGYNIVKIYADKAKTGTNDNRPQFQKMIKDAETGLFSYVIVYMVDRFARERYDSVMYKHRLRCNNVKVVSALENITDTDEGELYEAILEWKAAKYSRELSVRVKDGQIETYKNGTYNGGHCLYGYKVVDVGVDKVVRRVVIDDERAAAVKYLFTEYAAGRRKIDIVAELAERGYKTDAGKPLTLNSISNLMKNRKYTGTCEIGGHTVANMYPQIITPELFDKVQQRLSTVARAPASGKADTEYLLQGRAFCGHCGANMVGVSGTGRHGEKHYYYACAVRYKKHGCSKRNEKKDFLEYYAVEQTVNYFLNPKRLDYISGRICEERDKAKNGIEIRNIQSRIKKVESDVNKAVDAMIDAESKLARQALDRKIADYEIMLNDLRGELSRLELMNGITETKEQIAARISSFCNGNMFDDEFRRRIIKVLINALYVYDDKFVLYYNITGGKQVSFVENAEYLDEFGELPPSDGVDDTTTDETDANGHSSGVRISTLTPRQVRQC